MLTCLFVFEHNSLSEPHLKAMDLDRTDPNNLLKSHNCGDVNVVVLLYSPIISYCPRSLCHTVVGDVNVVPSSLGLSL